MKPRGPLLVLLLLINFNTIAQIKTYSNQGSSKLPFGDAINQATFLTETNYQPGLVGSNYLNEEWQVADVVFVWDSLLINDLEIKTNVKENVIEIKVDDQIKLLPAHQLLSYTLKKSGEQFVSHRAVPVSSPKGVFALLYNKKSALLCHYSTIIKEANYNVALNVGSKDDQVLIVKKYYAYLNQELICLPKSRRKLIAQFEGNQDLCDFIKKKKINPSKEKDLILFLSFYDSKE